MLMLPLAVVLLKGILWQSLGACRAGTDETCLPASMSLSVIAVAFMPVSIEWSCEGVTIG